MRAQLLLTRHADGSVTPLSVTVDPRNMQRLLGVTPLLKCLGIVGAFVRDIEIEDANLVDPHRPRRRGRRM